MVVTGNMVPVENTGHDFRSAKEVGKDLPEPDGYDQRFVLEKPGGEPSLAAVLESGQSGLRLEVRTTEPVCHLYTGRWRSEERRGGKGWVSTGKSRWSP